MQKVPYVVVCALNDVYLRFSPVPVCREEWTWTTMDSTFSEVQCLYL